MALHTPEWPRTRLYHAVPTRFEPDGRPFCEAKALDVLARIIVPCVITDLAAAVSKFSSLGKYRTF